MNKVLIIAGSDPSGGAGMQADMAAVRDLGGEAIFAVTALTAQNDARVLEIHPTPADLLTQQLSAACQGQTVGAVKIGMVATGANVRAILWFLQRLPIPHIIIDPVLHSSSGYSLLEKKALQIYRQQLLPFATIITPNLIEASALAGMQVDKIETMRTAAEVIYRELYTLRGGKAGTKPLAIIIKGGHLKGDAVDILYDGLEFTEFSAPRIAGRSPRGTGCRFASAIATHLTKENDLKKAIHAAKEYLRTYIGNVEK